MQHEDTNGWSLIQGDMDHYGPRFPSIVDDIDMDMIRYDHIESYSLDIWITVINNIFFRVL